MHQDNINKFWVMIELLYGLYLHALRFVMWSSLQHQDRSLRLQQVHASQHQVSLHQESLLRSMTQVPASQHQFKSLLRSTSPTLREHICDHNTHKIMMHKNMHRHNRGSHEHVEHHTNIRDLEDWRRVNVTLAGNFPLWAPAPRASSCVLQLRPLHQAK